MRSTNPVLNRLDETTRLESRVLGVGAAEEMTVDDVVVRTVGLLLLTGATALVSWLFVPEAAWVPAALAGSALASIALALVISLRAITNPLPMVAYAVVQGLLLGVASRAFELVYPGIVSQAVAGTFGVFLGMALLYRARLIRATPRLARLVIGTLLGIVAISVVNLVVYLVTGRQGLEVYSLTGEVGGLAYVFAVVAIIAGAFSFILDFDLVERSVRAGRPRRYAWLCAFGLLTGLVFLYWQLLRLLSYLRR
ncbi:Bax inhibitor-1/YccA family protein [Micromonospora sp. WMMD812]|uniref:Bax inhibitor-1/YccA family protein n=1 Tax=Micromonospora sp. WMMD812 TaxID=3015152 RepID=UPI00248B715F|nr:Bax inhibitor-1/YccA family protein [Micromonospora sp. WMMD812]WBB64947.1 Bax inhibitor-1/YccA family protein [Micromonospora sp. WMMD812]